LASHANVVHRNAKRQELRLTAFSRRILFEHAPHVMQSIEDALERVDAR
jgi:hypothetical protein